MNYTADFETTQTIPARVWCWALTEIAESFNTIDGTSIETFFNVVLSRRYKGAKIYFHNLKFDGQFILWHLMDKLKFPVTDDKKTQPRITTLIGNMGQYYQITVVNRQGYKVTFLDSLKKIPMSVSAAAKAFNLEESKLKIDYTLDRQEGYQPTQHEIEYTRTDTIIMAKCLYQQFNEGLTKMTIGADALANYKEIISLFRTHFPILDSETDSYIRKAYKGGFVYVQEGIAGKDISEGQVYDVNSMYPWAMLQPMPWGEPLYYRGEPDLRTLSEFRLSVCRYNLDAKVRLKRIPTLQVKGSRFLGDREIVKNTNGIIEVTLTNIDFELLCDHYDIIHCEKIDGYYFRSATGLFDKYVNHWAEVKANSTGGQRTIAKLMLNSLYGKFAKNPDVTGRTPYIDYEKGRLSLAKNDIEIAETVYLPVGAFITAYARNNLIRTAQQIYSRFLYCDTDSIHISGEEIPNIQIHANKLGYWKHESDFTRARFLHAKCYIEEIFGNIKATVAGLSKATLSDEYDNPVTWENFHTGAVYRKLKQKSVEGGAILYEDYHQLKEAL